MSHHTIREMITGNDSAQAAHGGGRPAALLLRAAALALVCALAAACVPVESPGALSLVAASQRPPTPAEVYTKIAPSIAFIETPTGIGSGVLAELNGDKYVVTNAHVVWPFSRANVVFPNQEEFLDTPLLQTNPLLDLALFGPIESPLPALPLDTQWDPAPGETVYLIGYPAEGELHPQAAISQGILSRTRVWDEHDGLRYFQTDAAGAGGQSGGALVSAQGDVVGITSMLLANAFMLAPSSADLWPHILRLAEIGSNEPIRGTTPEHAATKSQAGVLTNLWDTKGYVMFPDPDDAVKVTGDSDGDLALTLYNTYGEQIGYADDVLDGTEVVSGTATIGPHFLLVEQFLAEVTDFEIRSSHRLAPVDDPDDATEITVGQTITGSLDYPGDVDWYVLDLERRQSALVTADSTAIDTVVSIGPAGSGFRSYDRDEDSGRGIFGSNAQVWYRALRSGEHLIVVYSHNPADIGGYLLTVEEPVD